MIFDYRLDDFLAWLLLLVMMTIVVMANVVKGRVNGDK